LTWQSTAGLAHFEIREERVCYRAASGQAPWQDYVWLPDVVMIPMDPVVTTVAFGADSPAQMARASAQTDADGTRQAALLFPLGTSAQLVLPDGSRQPVSTLNVRATEFTVGSNGPAAMPAALPPSSAYTYCVEFSVEEAVAAGAKTITFDKCLIHYVENFLNFPIGSRVPVGFYDRERAVWVPSDNGRVIKILRIDGSLAELDVNGDGNADNGIALGVTDTERQQLASLYAAGQTLWRVPIAHFSPWDCNWPYGLPDGAGPGGGPPGDGGGGGGGGGAGGGGGGSSGGLGHCVGSNCDDEDSESKEDCTSEGSIIASQTQTLGETLPLTGMPFQLHYESDRVPGHKADYTLRIPLSASSVPDSLLRIELKVLVAGRIFTETFLPETNLTTTFTWDGLDAYGRSLQGDQPVTIRIGYVYPAVYRTPAENDQSFAQYGNAIAVSRARQEITIWREWNRYLGIWDARAPGLGGWTLNVHHAYLPLRQVLYLGNGVRRSTTLSTDLVIKTVAGGGESTTALGDGGVATEAWLGSPQSVAVGPDGSLFIADSYNNRVRRVGSDGLITTVAGNGLVWWSGDGGAATETSLAYPAGIAVGPDGSLYIADLQHYRIRRVGLDAIITTVAGNGINNSSGDGGPATNASLQAPVAVAVGPDGSLYIACKSNIRHVSPDGIIATLAGGAYAGNSGDNGPAVAALLNAPSGVAVGPEGIYISDTYNNRIRRVGTDGIITTVAGNGEYGFNGDGRPATETSLAYPAGIAIGPDGSLYIADVYNWRIRRVAPHGIISTVAGDGTLAGFGGDGGPATAAQISFASGVAVGPDRSIYIADTSHGRIRRATSEIPGAVAGDSIIPSENGRLLYLFDGQSRHLRFDALTGVSVTSSATTMLAA
jgi:sugar lactone lactonase YvrE/uncharacterized membrane protein YgcG